MHGTTVEIGKET